MLRSMYSGISGMKNFQTKLDVIGNNIANVNTAGFKKGRVTFKDTMNQTVSGASASTDARGGKNPTQVGLGSTLATIDTIHTGSSLQTTNRPLDLGIDGDGYFVVKQGDSEFYTRAGNFYLDDNGTLVNADGLKVQAYKYLADGKTLSNTYGDVAVNVNAVLPATTTNKITISGNLDPNTIDNNNDNIFTQQVKVVDSSGNEHTIDVHYKKISTTSVGTPAVATDTWHVFYGKTLDQIKGNPSATPPVAAINRDGVLTIDANNNSTFTPEAAFTTAGIPLPTTPVTYLKGVTISTEGITRNTGGSTVLSNPNGFTEGKLESFSIGSMGEINGVYSNGQISTLGRIAIAKFSNSSGLNKAGNNLFQETVNSGTPDINVAGEGRGTIASGSLEMSNVDLSEEFTEMITAQRGFQANTRIITTSDEILQELVNLKR